jgi:ABC-type microcin C transport system permease subunit YejE
MGWWTGALGGVPVVFHPGDHPNLHTLVFIEPQRRGGAVLLMNSQNVLLAHDRAFREIEAGVARFLAGPSLLFLILIAALVRGVSVQTMALIIGLFAWAWPARQVRAQVLSLKERDFVEVARMSGMSGLGIIVRELMPHMIQWLGANFVNAFIAAILAESGLSILGLGPSAK